MKYTIKTKLKDGSTVYRFVPPKDAKLSGVVKNKTFQDGRTARYEIPKLIKVVEDFRKGKILAGDIDVNSNLRQVLAHYYKTGQFNSLSLHTQKTYTYGFNKICVTKMFGRELGDITLKYLTPTHCTELYETWVKQVSVDNANQLSRIFSVLINFCISLGLMDRKLLALLCYEWGQRPVDIRLLKWSSIDFDNKMVTIKQTKRGATVQLPLEDKLEQLLLQQNEDWGFQDYVLPYQRPSDGAYSVIEHFQVSALANEVKALCGLPRELQMGDLRKTAITELIRSGVDQLAIMSVTGHRNVQSLNPYNKHNFNTAKSALEMRRK